MGALLHAVMSERDPERAEACRQAEEADALRGLAEFRTATFFQAKYGRRRYFLSQRDADAYDAGFTAFRSGRPMPQFSTPEWSGWVDAEKRELRGEA